MLKLYSRILNHAGREKRRLQGALVCAFLESILSKTPIFFHLLVLSGVY